MSNTAKILTFLGCILVLVGGVFVIQAVSDPSQESIERNREVQAGQMRAWRIENGIPHRCPECKMEIPQDARKCFRCGSEVY